MTPVQPAGEPRITPESADYLNHHRALPRAVVEVDEHELLPGAEREAAVAHRDGLRRAHDRRPDVGVRVGVVVQAVVLVVALRGDQSLERLIPAEGDYAHNRLNNDTNSHAHIKAAIVGPSETVPVRDGSLALGTWQQLVLVDFDDRPRERTVVVQVIG